MEQHQNQFYALWQSAGRIPQDDFDVSTMDAEDLVLAEAMVGEGLNRLMELKTRIENAKYKLQAPNLQRGVLPQTEERKEGVCVEANTDKAEAVQDKEGGRQAEGAVRNLQNIEEVLLMSASYMRSQFETALQQSTHRDSPPKRPY